jgi:hypothetical protein
MGRDSLDEKYGEKWKRTIENRRTIRIPDIVWSEIPDPKSEFIRKAIEKLLYRHDELSIEKELLKNRILEVMEYTKKARHGKEKKLLKQVLDDFF